MFQVNRDHDRLVKLEERTFSSLKFREREHLQEWLAELPSTLGEELLIFQKEFDGLPSFRMNFHSSLKLSDSYLSPEVTFPV